MYESYWKLSEKPFSNTPNPRFLYHSQQHEDTLMKLTYAIAEGMGAALLTGVFGCGKTIVGKALIEALGTSKYKFALINNPQGSPVELLRAIVRNLRAQALPERRTEVMADSLLETLNEVLLDTMRDGKETVIIIDEAHTLDAMASFEELRMLLNFQSDSKFLLTLLLFGQPELKDKVANLKQLDQRIAIRCHLDRLTLEETKAYIEHRLTVAQCPKNPFTDEAMDMIYERAGGIPRRVNHACDLSLLTAFGRKVEKIDEGIVAAAYEQFGTT